VAIVFISPKQRQRMFFTGIAACLALIVLIISLMVLFARPAPVKEDLVFNRPKIDIDFSALDSEMVKNFDTVTKIEMQYAYTAENSKGIKTSGIITASSPQEAQKILTEMKFKNIVLRQATAGRNNPFAPYYDLSGEPVLEESNLTPVETPVEDSEMLSPNDALEEIPLELAE